MGFPNEVRQARLRAWSVFATCAKALRTKAEAPAEALATPAAVSDNLLRIMGRA